MTKRDRLFGLMTNIDDRWMDRSKQAGRQIASDCYSSRHQKESEFVYPCREMKLLHQFTIAPSKDALKKIWSKFVASRRAYIAPRMLSYRSIDWKI